MPWDKNGTRSPLQSFVRAQTASAALSMPTSRTFPAWRMHMKTKSKDKLRNSPHAESKFTWIFEYILENKDMLQACFKLGVNYATADFKTVYFRNGFNFAAKLWFVV